MRRSAAWFLVCVLWLAAGPLWAAYLESDVGAPVDRVDVPGPPRRVIPPRPRPGNPLVDLIRQVDVGAAYTRHGLTFFPLTLPRGGRGSGVITLDEALRRDRLVIREKGSAEVPRVSVRNDGGAPVFLNRLAHLQRLS